MKRCPLHVILPLIYMELHITIDCPTHLLDAAWRTMFLVDASKPVQDVADALP